MSNADSWSSPLPMKSGLKVFAAARGDFASIDAFSRALGEPVESRRAKLLVQRMVFAGYVVKVKPAVTGINGAAHRLNLTMRGWKAYQRHLWSDPRGMAVDLDLTAYLANGTARQAMLVNMYAPDPDGLAKLLRDNDSGASAV